MNRKRVLRQVEEELRYLHQKIGILQQSQDSVVNFLSEQGKYIPLIKKEIDLIKMALGFMPKTLKPDCELEPTPDYPYEDSHERWSSNDSPERTIGLVMQDHEKKFYKKNEEKDEAI